MGRSGPSRIFQHFTTTVILQLRIGGRPFLNSDEFYDYYDSVGANAFYYYSDSAGTGQGPF